MSDTPHEMQVLVTAVDAGGFTAAAERLGLSPSAISKIVSRLEGRLGVRLLNRTTRRIDLTPEGQLYVERARQILADINDVESSVSEAGVRPKGLLRVNIGVAFGIHQLVPAVPDFLARYPDVHLSLDVTDRMIDVIADRADLAVRTGRLADSSLIARKISEMTRVIVASPSYLAKHGTPKEPADLLNHNCLIVADAPSLSRWPFRGENGVETLEVRGNVVASSADALVNLALSGVGIVRFGDVILGPHIRAGRLVPILVRDHLVEPVPISAVYPPGRQRVPKIRAFVDFLVERFGNAPWRDPAPEKDTGGLAA